MTVDGHDIVRDYRKARAAIGLVPQELATDTFEAVSSTVRFVAWTVRQAPRIRRILEKTLRSLALWDKRDYEDHDAVGWREAARADREGAVDEPRILFLDEQRAPASMSSCYRRDVEDGQ